MDENCDIVNTFEEILRNKRSVKPIPLYGDSKSYNLSKNQSKTSQCRTPHDVLVSVSKQIKAIQNADSITNYKKINKVNSFKQSTFLPVTVFEKESRAHQAKHVKFETQCVSDSQLISLIQDAEIMDVQTGVTQEFDHTFCQNYKSFKNHDANNDFNDSDEELNEIAMLSDNNSIIIADNLRRSTDNDLLQNNHFSNSSNCGWLRQSSNVEENMDSVKTVNNDSSTEMSFPIVDISLKASKINVIRMPEHIYEDIEDLFEKELTDANERIDFGDKIDEVIDLPSSPIFGVKSVKKSQKLVFDLHKFEEFEQIVTPILETVDFETAKCLINSQLIGKELLLQSAKKYESIQHKSEQNINIFDTPLNTIQENRETTLDNKDIRNKKVKTSDEKVQIDVRDEILFSSDEEEELMRKDSEEIPLTCQLDLSGFEKDNFDETMYVGFQTASNKSIQICTKSFSKAKYIFDNVNLTMNGKETLIADLVNKFDDQSKQNNDDPKTSEISFQNIEFNNPSKPLGDKVHFENKPVSNKINNYDGLPSFNNTVYSDDMTLTNIPVDRVVMDSNQLPKQYADIERTHLFDTIENMKDLITDIITQDDEANDTGTYEKIAKVLNSTKPSAAASLPDNVLNTSFLGFKTASNKIIGISKNALIKSKKLLEDINLDVPKCLSEPNIINVYTKFESTNFIKDVNISTKNKTKNIQKCIDEVDSIIHCNTTTHQQTTSTEYSNKLRRIITESEMQKCKSFPGFKTANNKEIKISQKAILKSKNILQNCEDTSFVDDRKQFDRFKTTSNKNIKLPDTGFAKSFTLFQIQNNSKKSIHEMINEDIVSPFKTKTNSAMTFTNDTAVVMSNENKTAQFQGFQTASNKPIEISTKALENSKKIFQNIDDDTSIFCEKNVNSCKDLTEKKVVEDLLENSNVIEEFEMEVFENDPNINFEDLESTSENKMEKSDVYLPKSIEPLVKVSDVKVQTSTVKKPAKFEEFKTANNNQIFVSKETLERTKKIFEGIDSLNTDNLLKQESTKFSGFKTASDKIIVVSKEALARSKHVFDEIDNFKEINQRNQETEKYVGFQTASNKEVTVSKTALARSKKIFEGIDCLRDDGILKPETEKFVGFQTASRKEVTISKEALARSKNIFEGIDCLRDDDILKPETEKFVGFQTASKKKVTISKEALAKSKKIFEGIDCLKDDILKPETAKFVGFQTASKKEVTISKEALAKSKKIFEQFDHIIEDIHEIPKPAKFIGFHTASNKQVNISEEALAQSKNLLETCEPNSYIDSDKRTPKNTAVEQNIAYRNVIDDKHNVDDNTNKIRTHIPFAGFQTASKKQVIVSEDAMLKSKLLFKDLQDQSSENDTNLNNKVNSDEDIIQSQVFTLKNVSKTDSMNIDFDSEVNNVTSKNATANLDCLMDTQLLNNFEQTLYTEDFDKDVSRKSKRSGSPILSCPKPKKRKRFEIPYSQKKQVIIDCVSTEETPNISTLTYNLDLPKIEFDTNYKKNKKYTLKDLENFENDYPEKEIDSYILNFNFEEILNFDFFGKRNEITNTKLTVKDIKYIFEKSVNKKLIPENWIENHLQLILWKLLSYEIRFPKSMYFTCTAKNVIDQLKYRYDKELFNMDRPSLRKIFEKDDIPSRCMVLCVVLIYENGVSVSRIASPLSSVEILLTDGWYSIKTTIDKMLTKLIFDGRIKIGCKLMIQGAELIGCEQGVAPWEDTSAIRLKITGNSTRPVKWHVKLGYSAKVQLSRISQVSSDGGRVSRLRVFVSRVYPALYVEKLEDKSTVTRSERLELLHQMKHETERQTLIEKIYEEVEKEFQDQDSQESDGSEPSSKRQCLETGSQIARVMRSAKDPGDFQSHLTSTQNDLLQEHTMQKRDKLIQHVQERVKQKIDEAGLHVNRNVVTLVKVRLVDVEERRDKTEINRALLSIWKPNDLVMEVIKEGSWIEIMNIVPTAVRYSEIQISANRQSIFTISKQKESERISAITSTLNRICYPLGELTKSPSMITEYNEIDTVGFIFLIEPDSKNFDPCRSQFQNIFLSDSDKNIVSVNFWGGLKKFGFDNLLDTGQIVTCVNLQKRAGNSRKNIPQYRATEYSYFTKTPKSDVARKLIEDLSVKFSTIDRRKFCEDCVSLKSNYSIVKFQGAEISPYRFQDVNLSKNKVFIDSPLTHKNEDLNLTGLDFESTFKQTDTQELSPKTLLRKKRVNDKIAKLKYYGEPPALSPIQLINISKNATNAFKSPFQPKEDVASKENVVLKQQNMVENTEENINLSPVLNKTYVKRNINPVKLNFTNVVEGDMENSINVDHFAEDFDGSPPLSLE